MDKKPRFKEYPAKVDNLIGRQKEMFEVIHTIYHNRLVTIIGLPGIGKTALAKNSVDYMACRQMFSAGIIFMQLKGYMNCEIFMKNLLINFVIDNFELQ